MPLTITYYIITQTRPLGQPGGSAKAAGRSMPRMEDFLFASTRMIPLLFSLFLFLLVVGNVVDKGLGNTDGEPIFTYIKSPMNSSNEVIFDLSVSNSVNDLGR